MHPAHGFALIPLDLSDFPTGHNYVLALWQSHFERVLAGWVDELGVRILRGRDWWASYTAPGSFPSSVASQRRLPYLIRPDGYVGWAGNGTDTGLGDALTTWFGAR